MQIMCAQPAAHLHEGRTLLRTVSTIPRRAELQAAADRVVASVCARSSAKSEREDRFVRSQRCCPDEAPQALVRAARVSESRRARTSEIECQSGRVSSVYLYERATLSQATTTDHVTLRSTRTASDMITSHDTLEGLLCGGRMSTHERPMTCRRGRRGTRGSTDRRRARRRACVAHRARATGCTPA